MRLTFILFICLCALSSASQQMSQTVRGSVLDADTRGPLTGAAVMVYKDGVLLKGATTDEDGLFRLTEIPAGRFSLRVVLTGYSNYQIDGVELTSAKELIIEILLSPIVTDMDEVVVRSAREGEVRNEMSTISSREFSVEETDRYAGSRGDPARMASNFAGVQGADDSRNDIVIRGNSPQGVLWRMEGVDLPNPNHFNIPGTAGGPVSIINNKYLANSDFYTGAFPAEFGNCTAGVFDLRMRNGNNESSEHSAQFGFLGTELFTEGPLSKTSGASYLAGFRYSTVKMFSLLGIDIGTSAVPRYYDGVFRLSFPMKNRSNFSTWGIFGSSSVDILISDQTDPDETNLYGENDRDQYYSTGMFAWGNTYTRSFGEKTFMKTSLAFTSSVVDSYHELVYRHIDTEGNFAVDSLSPLLDYRFDEKRIAFSHAVNHRFNPKWLLRAGIMADLQLWSMIDSVRIIDTSACDYYSWQTRWDNSDNGWLLRSYAQIKYRPNDKFSVTGGLHASAFTLNHSYSAPEPRLGFLYQWTPTFSIRGGAGIHSQLQPSYMYFYKPGAPSCTIVPDVYDQPGYMPNRNMGLTQSIHYVLGAQKIAWEKVRVLAEVYLQDLRRVPVEINPSSFSLVNTGAGFSRFFPGHLTNEGVARNVGAELTVERFFHHHWLALFTASVFDATYRGSDGVWRNTDFNGGYALNVLASREWPVGKNSKLITGAKLTTAGGRWYGPADEDASNQAREVVYVDSLRNTLQFAPYFRFDVKVNFRFNRKNTSHDIGLDLVNLGNRQNVLKLTWAPDDVADTPDIREEYQLGFLPIFYYRVDF
ncbi:MAG: TonB-dependent receptor [Flavobacteriales bacterium]|nr:TonB-dependent receptor [Flavobacteriales bacterium]